MDQAAADQTAEERREEEEEIAEAANAPINFASSDTSTHTQSRTVSIVSSSTATAIHSVGGRSGNNKHNHQPSLTNPHNHHHHHHSTHRPLHRPHNYSFSSSAPSHDPRHRQFHPLHRHHLSTASSAHPPTPATPAAATPSFSSPAAAVAAQSSHWQPLQLPSSSPFITPTSSRPSTPRRGTAARLANPRNYSPRTPPTISVKRVENPLPDTPPKAEKSQKKTEPKRQRSVKSPSEKRHSKYSLRSWPSLKSPSSSLQAELGSQEDRRRISDSVSLPGKILTRQKPRAYSLGGPPAGFAQAQARESAMAIKKARQDAPIPAGVVDMESGQLGNRLRSNSKASLPLPAHSDAQQEQQRQSAASESPIEWGPMHPCYPHLNPHIPVDSPLYSATRIIRIPRDWMLAGDLAPTFANVYPEVLDGTLSEQQFRDLLRYLNDELTTILNPFGVRNWVDSFIGLVTFWLWDDFGLTAVKRRLAALETWIEKWNREVGSNDGVQIIPLRRTAYMSLDIQIPDPQISPEPVSRANLHPNDATSPHPHSPYGIDNMPARVAAAA